MSTKPSAVEAALGDVVAQLSDQERADAAARVAAKWNNPKPHKAPAQPKSRNWWPLVLVGLAVLIVAAILVPKILQATKP